MITRVREILKYIVERKWAFSLALFLVICIFAFLKYDSISEKAWQAIASIGQVSGALFTALAVYVALQPGKPKIEIDFKMNVKENDDDEAAKLFIFNTSRSIAIVHEIRIEVDRVPGGELVHYSYNSLRSSHRDYSDPISILPYQSFTRTFKTFELIWGVGHTIDDPDEKTKDKKIKIVIVVNNQEFVFKTDLTYESYYNSFV